MQAMSEERIRPACSKCLRDFESDTATVLDVFGYKSPGARYKMCKQCRAQMREWNKTSCERNRAARYEYSLRYKEQNAEQIKERSRRDYENNREAKLAYAKEYQQAHREEIEKKQCEKIACYLCGRTVRRDGMNTHQETRLCDKNRPAP